MMMMMMMMMMLSLGYEIPRCKTVEDYKAFIDTLPMVDSPETFGLHSNADITYLLSLPSSLRQLETALFITLFYF